MTDIYTAPAAPPAPVHVAEKKSHRGLLIGVIVASALVLVGLAGYSFHEHQSLTKAHAHSATLSHQLGKTKNDLKGSELNLEDTKNDLSNANNQLRICSTTMSATRHLWKSFGAEVNAAGEADGSYTKILYLGTALREIKKVNTIVTNAGYSSYDDMLNSCDGGDSA